MRRGLHLPFLAMLIACIGTSVALLLLDGKRARADQFDRELTRLRSVQSVTDVRGSAVPVAEYRRILSASSIADAVLPELVATDRIVGVSRWYLETDPHAARLAGKVSVSGLEDLERIFALQPDLVIVSNYTPDPSPIERLRERGIRVFDLGPMLGRVTLERNLRDLGQLLGQAALGKQMADQLGRRMANVAARIPIDRRKRAMYLNLYDTQLHGGTLGSSYYDVLTAAGLLDVAAAGRRFDHQGTTAWPRYRTEELLLFAPELIVTIRGKGKSICALSGLESLRACQAPNGIIELDEWQLNDPGPGMLATAELICDRAYPALRPAAASVQSNAAPPRESDVHSDASMP